MKYYFIRQPVDKKVVGINDGGVQAEIVESKWKNKKELKRYNEDYILGIFDLLERIENGEVIPPPVLEYIKVRPQSILTDFLSFSEDYAGGEYLISRKGKEILKQYNINCRFYDDVGLYQKDKKIEGYSNLHLFPLKGRNAFRFDQSVFFTGHKLRGKKLKYAKNFEEYHDMYVKDDELVEYESLSLNSSVIGNLDMFTFDIHPRIYVSERLKNAMETAGITGIKYYEPEEPRLEVV